MMTSLPRTIAPTIDPGGQLGLSERLADDGRGPEGLCLDDLGSAVADRVHRQDAAAPNPPKNRGDRRLSWAHGDVDTETPHQRAVAGVVDQGDRGSAAGALRQKCRQNVHFVVVGDSDHRLGQPNIDFDEDFGVQRIAANNGCAGEPLRQIVGALRLQLDHLNVEPGIGLLQLLRQEVADVAATDDDHAARLGLLMPEDGHAARNMVGVHGEVDFIADQHLIVAARHDETRIPADR